MNNFEEIIVIIFSVENCAAVWDLIKDSLWESSLSANQASFFFAKLIPGEEKCPHCFFSQICDNQNYNPAWLIHAPFLMGSINHFYYDQDM